MNGEDAVSSQSALITQAHHHGDEDVRLNAGVSLVNRCANVRDYNRLIALASDEGLLQAVRELARDGIAAAASERGYDAMHEVATRQDTPVSIRLQVAGMLFEDYFNDLDAAGLMRLASDERIAYDVRVKAGVNVVEGDAASRRLGTLLELVKNPKLPYEARKRAGESLMALAAIDHNYPMLLRLSTEDGVPMNIRIAADEKAESAALSALEDAHSRGDGAMIADMASDKRLPEMVREQADSLSQSIAQRSSMRPSPTVEMVADAMRFSRSMTSTAGPKQPSQPPLAVSRLSSKPPKLNR